MVSALIDCLRRPNTSLPHWILAQFPPPQMEPEGNPVPPEPSRGMQTCSPSITSVPTPGLHLRSLMGGGESIYLSISEAMIGWTLQRVLHIASDILDGTSDCAETVASNGYSFKKDRTSPIMCSASDSLICAAMKVALMRTYCRRLSMGLTI